MVIHAYYSMFRLQFIPIPMRNPNDKGSQKHVTPAKAGVQKTHKYHKILDSGFRRNDGI